MSLPTPEEASKAQREAMEKFMDIVLALNLGRAGTKVVIDAAHKWVEAAMRQVASDAKAIYRGASVGSLPK